MVEATTTAVDSFFIFSKDEQKLIETWFLEPIPRPISRAGKYALNMNNPPKQRNHKKKHISHHDHLIDATSEVHVVSKFKSETNEPAIKLMYMNCIQSIIVRENYILNLSKLIKYIEDLYWRYSILKIRDHENKSNKHREELMILKTKIFVRQEELVVALAHMRASSIDVVQNIRSYRRGFAKVTDLEEPTSIVWQGQNYLLKMLDDIQPFNDSHIIKMWIGCEVSMFILIPEQHDHMNAIITRDILYKEWLENHKRETRGCQLVQGSLGIMEEVAETDRTLIKLPPVSMPLEHVNDEAEIEKFRELCSRSWLQPNLEHSFWNDLSIDASTARAVAGFKELMPIQPLIPDVPLHLVRTCTVLEQIVLAEEQLQIKLTALREKSTDICKNTESLDLQAGLLEVTLGLRSENSMYELSLLRHRQETAGGSIMMSPHSPHAGSIFGRKLEQDVTLMMSSNTKRTTESTIGLPPISASLRLNDSKVQSELLQRVDDSRRYIERQDGILTLIDRKRRCNRNLPPRMEETVAIGIIQRLARKYLCMCRSIRKLRIDTELSSVHIIQRVVRGFVGRRKFQYEKKIFKMMATLVRKYVVRQQLAAQKITKFIRRTAYIAQKTLSLCETSHESLIEVEHRHKIYHLYRLNFDKACTQIQKRWRGILGRKRFKRFLRFRKKQRVRDSRYDSIERRKSNYILAFDDAAGIQLNTRDRTISEFSEGRASTPGSPIRAESPAFMTTLGSDTIFPENNLTTDSAALFSTTQETTKIKETEKLERAVSVSNLKASLRHNILLPIHGYTKGKLLSGKTRQFLKEIPTRNADITWKDFYRPPNQEKTIATLRVSRSHSAIYVEELDPALTLFLRNTLK